MKGKSDNSIQFDFEPMCVIFVLILILKCNLSLIIAFICLIFKASWVYQCDEGLVQQLKAIFKVTV
jgi:hypothetical protein